MKSISKALGINSFIVKGSENWKKLTEGLGVYTTTTENHKQLRHLKLSDKVGTRGNQKMFMINICHDLVP